MHASVVVPVREHCTGFPAHPAYGFVPSKAAPVWSSRKKKRGLRGTVVIFSERADAVTAGVLTKETVFFVRNNTNFDLMRSSRIVASPRSSR